MRLLAVLLAAACLAPALASAQVAPATAPVPGQTPSQTPGPAPVVLELYTSQGCSSCPPADALFAELVARDDVIALALHVDYWDYLGWKDVFARPRHTARQKAYAKAARSRTIFTPEMVIQGEDRLKGHDAAGILQEIIARRDEPPGALLSVGREGEEVRIDVAPPGTGILASRSNSGSIGAPIEVPPGSGMAAERAYPFRKATDPAADIHVVRYVPEEEVAIEGGENAGQTVTYHNIVTDWQTIGQWDGRSEAEFIYRSASEGPIAVIVQRTRMGPILAAARLP